MKTKKRTIMMVLAIAVVCSFAISQVQGKPEPNPLKNVYFGEQHRHTQDSPDAFAMGTRNTIDDAYNFAKGKPIKKSTTGKFERVRCTKQTQCICWDRV